MLIVFSSIASLGLETSLIDGLSPDLLWERQKVVDIMCDDNNPENWEDILADAPEEFKQAVLKYAKENLIKMHLFISSPFTTAYQRCIETTKINFIANVGGKSVNYLIRNIFKYFFRINGIVYGF